jgi:hypothetical protein
VLTTAVEDSISKKVWCSILNRMQRAAAEDDELQESLLGGQQPSSGPIRPAQHQQQLIHYQPFSVHAFIQWVLHSWQAFLSKCLF